MKKIGVIEKLKTDTEYRAMFMIIVLGTGFSLIFLLNTVTSHFQSNTMLYQDKEVFPVFSPAGNDFRVGYYWPAYYLVESHFTSIGPNGTYPSNYPPLVAISSLPYALFNMTTAYTIHVVILILLNLACLLMAVLLVKLFLLEKFPQNHFLVNVISILLFFLAAIYIFSSYFFLYSIERGNTDIIAMFYCLLALWVLIKKPKNVWLQVILLSVAVHFKIYPIVLFPLLFMKHGKKLILPALVINIAFLFCLGPNIAWKFVQSMTSGGTGVGIGNTWSNIGNHASYSFIMVVDNALNANLLESFFVYWAITLLVPLLIWGIAAIAIALQKYSTLNAVLFFMVSIPLMSLLPTVSMDYKLVIFGAEIILLLGIISKLYLQRYSLFDLIQVILIIFILLMIHRSYTLNPEVSVFIRNKYIWVLLLEIFLCVNILRSQKKCYQLDDEIIQSSTSG